MSEKKDNYKQMMASDLSFELFNRSFDKHIFISNPVLIDNIGHSNYIIKKSFLKIVERINAEHEIILSSNDFERKLKTEYYDKCKRIDVILDNVESQVQSKKTINSTILLLLLTAFGFSIGLGISTTEHYFLINTPEKSYTYITDFKSKTDSASANPYTKNHPISDIAKLVEPSIVAVNSYTLEDDILASVIPSISGSGIIFDVTDKHIYIVTNNHVIDESNSLYINFSDNIQYEANLIGVDSDSDLAVLTVKKTLLTTEEFNNIKPIAFGNSADVVVGELAIAIGNPLGYNNTVTAGIISAVNRIIKPELNLLPLIQTDAAINPGNSGGALINSSGELIGINTVKIADTAIEGIGFAIPINLAIPIIEEILEKGYVARPYIGIVGADVPTESQLNYGIPAGVLISYVVTNSPASKAGLNKYDIIVKIDEHEIRDLKSLHVVINKYKVGDKIRITIKREINLIFYDFSIELIIDDKKHFN